MAQKLRLPNETQRLVIVGRTGSGKTLAALWMLALMDWLSRPWYILDFKGDPSLARLGALEDVEYRSINDPIERGPGIYIVSAQPDDEIDEFLWRIWAHENVGLYIDEGYMVGDGKAFRALLTQGRSKRIPMIILSQRPVWLSRFVFSEADFYQIFWLNDERDRKTVLAFVPYDLNKRLPEYHSVWYDVGRDSTDVLAPVPDLPDILREYEIKLEILAKMRVENSSAKSETENPNKRTLI